MKYFPNKKMPCDVWHCYFIAIVFTVHGVMPNEMHFLSPVEILTTASKAVWKIGVWQLPLRSASP